MKIKRSGIAAIFAISALSFSVTSQAEMVRAFWAATVAESVSGNAYDLAVGNKLLAEMQFDTDWMQSFSGFAPSDSLMVDANFFTSQSSNLLTEVTGFSTPVFNGQIRFLDAMAWEVLDAGVVVASGTWSLDSIKFQEPRVVPVPAALPLLIGALGILAGFRRK